MPADDQSRSGSIPSVPVTMRWRGGDFLSGSGLASVNKDRRKASSVNDRTGVEPWMGRTTRNNVLGMLTPGMRKWSTTTGRPCTRPMCEACSQPWTVSASAVGWRRVPPVPMIGPWKSAPVPTIDPALRCMITNAPPGDRCTWAASACQSINHAAWVCGPRTSRARDSQPSQHGCAVEWTTSRRKRSDVLWRSLIMVSSEMFNFVVQSTVRQHTSINAVLVTDRPFLPCSTKNPPSASRSWPFPPAPPR